MKRIPAGFLIIGTLATAGTVAFEVKCAKDRAERFEMFGGRENYEKQLAKHLERVRKNDFVTDPAVRAADAAAIDAAAQEIGKNWETPELGEELKRIK